MTKSQARAISDHCESHLVSLVASKSRDTWQAEQTS